MVPRQCKRRPAVFPRLLINMRVAGRVDSKEKRKRKKAVSGPALGNKEGLHRHPDPRQNPQQHCTELLPLHGIQCRGWLQPHLPQNREHQRVPQRKVVVAYPQGPGRRP